MQLVYEILPEWVKCVYLPVTQLCDRDNLLVERLHDADWPDLTQSSHTSPDDSDLLLTNHVRVLWAHHTVHGRNAGGNRENSASEADVSESQAADAESPAAGPEQCCILTVISNKCNQLQ